ncbi:Uncharacterised protein [Yersinia similis]|uniref:Uncharacterized protein n=1 Tax=Yersinia similis TaxID=367190 RepID=A0A0T9NN18_9GAMM|nr:Uncharacterised protein [Yersinia similis]CNC55861.1 Uncharacterised protein [Yersinia similis]CNF25557.1 Uncharacterised protein [Yersinia similis]CNG65840.1 Uncharacterised protein [Yersinia similis]CNH21130.1 Uncharacterised protein [Yersinia similis]
MGIKYNIIQFEINELGIDINLANKAFSFELLPWDHNDVKLSQLRFLMKKLIAEKKLFWRKHNVI